MSFLSLKTPTERKLFAEVERLTATLREVEQDVVEARRQRDEFRTKKPAYLPPPFDKQELTRRVAGAVDSAMAAHGPITPQSKSSLTKRITGELYTRQAVRESAESRLTALEGALKAKAEAWQREGVHAGTPNLVRCAREALALLTPSAGCEFASIDGYAACRTHDVKLEHIVGTSWKCPKGGVLIPFGATFGSIHWAGSASPTPREEGR